MLSTGAPFSIGTSELILAPFPHFFFVLQITFSAVGPTAIVRRCGFLHVGGGRRDPLSLVDEWIPVQGGSALELFEVAAESNEETDEEKDFSHYGDIVENGSLIQGVGTRFSYAIVGRRIPNTFTQKPFLKMRTRPIQQLHKQGNLLLTLACKGMPRAPRPTMMKTALSKKPNP